MATTSVWFPAAPFPMTEPHPTPHALRRLSPWRVVVAIAILGGAAYGLPAAVRADLSSASAPADTFFAPYVDVTATPTYNFQSTVMDPARQAVLGFVVASPTQPCSPSWGGYYSLTQADTALDLSLRVTQYQSTGAQVGVAFGGQANTPLASACTSVSRLAAAYRDVAQHYRVHTLDFDVEGAALADGPATVRRAEALAQLERPGGPLAHAKIWLTLPVSTSGLSADALSQIGSLLSRHVALAGVDVMAMNYGRPVADMAQAAESAVRATAAQFQQLAARYGSGLSGADLWTHLGLTVMVGQNDSAGEVVSVADARRLVGFARTSHLGRLSMWSLNRDAACGTTGAEQGVLSTSCSGVNQGLMGFSAVFDQLRGSMDSARSLSTTPLALDTNPADAPYPLWAPTSVYVQGYKVVRAGYIYQARWYNSGVDPAARVANPWNTPWVLVGPVLKGSHPPTTTTLPAGTAPEWSTTAVYRAGDEVLYQGLPYRAKWYNVGAVPTGALGAPSASPWTALYTVPGEPTS